MSQNVEHNLKGFHCEKQTPEEIFIIIFRAKREAVRSGLARE